MNRLATHTKASFSLEEEFYNRFVTLLEERLQQEHSGTLFSYANSGETLHSVTSIPSRKHLKEIVETAFWASLQREEGRPLEFSVGYNESVRSVTKFYNNRYFLFDRPLPFNVNSIAKIAPAVGRRNLGIAVAPTPELSICGLLNHFGAPFIVRTLDPGQLAIKFLDTTVAAVSGTAAIWIGDQLSTRNGPVWYRNDGGSTHAMGAILSALRAMRVLHHGGAIIIVPEGDAWRSSVHENIPYFGEDYFTGIYEAMYELDQAERNQMLQNRYEEEEVRLNSAMVAQWKGRLEEASADLAQLTAVDGATVVTKNLAVLGFGVKLKSSLDENILSIYVTDLLNLSEQNKPSSLNALGGTRHQSAALFIAEQHEATALVVSQDGNISAFTWHESGEVVGAEKSGVYVYRHLELTL